MSTLAKLTRRGFLIVSAAIAGGVAFGIYTVKKPHANPLLDGLGEGERVVANGTSCRHQIRDVTGREALHVIRVLDEASGG